MGLPLTDDNGVVQTIANGTPVVWSAGLGYDANGLLCVTSTTSATDVWINGWRRDALGRLVVSQSTPEGQPFIYNAGWPTDKNTGAIITQQNTPAPTDPRIAGVAVGPLGGVYMTEGGYIWTPAVMFLAGEKGGLWDFSTLANLYQDSAGTTPCTAVGDPIGLVLDTKNGTPQLGPELVTNGDFSNGATGWAGDGVWSFSGGAATHSGGVAAYLTQYSALYGYLGKILAITYTVTANVGGRGLLLIGAYWSTGTINIPSTVGTHTVYAASSTVDFWLYCNAVGTSLTIDNISVREITGNHLTQSTSTKRPVLGRMPATGVRNLLTYTEQITTSPWAYYNSGNGAALSPIVAPDGTTTAIGLNDTSGAGYYGVTTDVPIAVGLTSTFSCYAKQGTNTTGFSVWLIGSGGNTYFQGSLNWSGGIPTASGWVSEDIGAGWYRVSFDFVAGASTVVSIYLLPCPTSPSETGSTYFWGTQLELGSTATAYQKVGAAYDVTESGVASVYTAYFDGVDDCLVSPSIDFSGTDAMSVFSGFRKTSDAERGMVAELSATTASNNGSFALTAPNAASATIVYESKGTSLTDTSATIAAPADSVISAVSDISADSNVLRRNGAQTDSDTGDQGTGNFGNYPLYVGQRGAATLPYKGFLSALCTRGAATDATTITNMEQWLAARTPGVTLPTWVGRYNYVTPPTSSIPVAGEITHGDNLLNKLNFSKTDLDGQTYTGPPLTTGHEVKIGDQVYTLVAPPVDFSSYITLTIEPATQLADGTYPVLVY